MGFSSSLCAGCYSSLRSSAATTARTAWMTQVVSVSASNVVAQGTYDGYGSIVVLSKRQDDVMLKFGLGNYRIPQKATVYHQRCWALLGQPGYLRPRERADDQGYFVDSVEGPPEPKTKVEVVERGRAEIRFIAEERKRQAAEERKYRSFRRKSN